MRRARRGFTLVELLVALALAIVLLGLAVAVSQSSLFDSYKVVGAGDRISQWLVTARNRAVRDKLPRGLRLMGDTNPQAIGRSLIRECVYIEQPEAWVGGQSVGIVYDASWTRYPNSTNPLGPGSFGAKRLWITDAPLADFEYFGRPSNSPNWPPARVRPGDTIRIPGLGLSALIAQITVHNSPTTADAQSPTPPTILSPPAPQADPANGGTAPGNALAAFQLFLSDPFTNTGNDGTDTAPPTGFMLYQRDALPDLPITGVGPVAGFRSAAYRTSGAGFAVSRDPQPLAGEPALQLSPGMAVDFENSLTTRLQAGNLIAGDDLVGGVNNYTLDHYDIVFAPSGEVTHAVATYRHKTQPPNVFPNKTLVDRRGLIVLTVRDTNKTPTFDINTPADRDTAGELVLVVINTRVGSVSTQPAGPAGGPGSQLPYQFAKDGINTGL